MTAVAVDRRPDFARSRLVLIALVMSLAPAGCSHFKGRKGSVEKPVATLGSELPDRDIYAKGVDRTNDSPLAASTQVETPITQPTLAGEIVPASDLDDHQPAASDPGVVLHSPISVDPAKIGSSSTTAGVPNGARLIAGSGPRRSPAVAPETSSNQVVQAARQALDAMTTYQLSLRRQERVDGILLPAEDLVMSIRREPKAARLSWVDGPHRGREVLYRADDGAGLMHVNMADSKIPIPRMALAPDSPMVMKNSRHPITEAGLDPLVAGMELAAQAGELTDLGTQTPSPLTTPQRGVLRRTPAGEVWRAFFDPTNHLPSLVECRARNGDLLESYLFTNVQPDPAELATVAAFDPAARWGPPRGLFGRMAPRTAAGESSATSR